MDALEILKQLIAIPSVSPMGRDLTGPEYYETRLTEFLAGFFKDLGVEYEVIDVVPGRSNVVAIYRADKNAPTILMDAHQDTVPVDGMTIDPFDPVVKDGRIYGRGACDVKGGMAAMLSAFSRLVKENPDNANNVVMSCTCDEEATVMGIKDLVKLWSDGENRSQMLGKRPDVSIVAEPTEMDLVVAHRGATRWKIFTSGVACHSSDPTKGVNAIYRMAKILSALEEYADMLDSLVKPHSRCGSATLSIGLISGGISVNTVPDTCEIEVDRRVIPGEDGLQVMEDVREFLKQRVDFDFEFSEPWIIGTALPDDTNDDLGNNLLKQINAVTGGGVKVGVPYGTHASRIAEADVPAVVFGPGSVAQAHTKDEWLDIGQLEQATEVYYQACCDNGLAAAT